jgi:hypothetical protein
MYAPWGQKGLSSVIIEVSLFSGFEDVLWLIIVDYLVELFLTEW